MTRGWGIVVAALATVGLLLAMSPADDRMTETGGAGIVPFELSGGQHRADEILAEWGEAGKDAARESLWIDFGFLVAYGVLLTLALRAVRDTARRHGWARFEAIGGVVVWFGVAAAACDALENVFLLLTIGGAGSACPSLATIFAACKFAFLATSIAYLLAGAIMRGSSNRSDISNRMVTAMRCSGHRRGRRVDRTTLPKRADPHR